MNIQLQAIANTLRKIFPKPSPPRILNPFSIFVILYMMSFLSEMTEKWKHVGFTWAFLIVISILSFTRITQFKFLFFLLSTTIYILWFRFPEVANHVNLILLINIPLILVTLDSLLRSHLTDEAYFKRLLPFLRISLILAYILAGFHKLNQDFFNPDVSCLGWFLGAFISVLTTSRVLMIPSVLIVFAILGVLFVRFLLPILKRLSKSLKISVVLSVLLMSIIAGMIVLLTVQGKIAPGFRAVVILAVASVVILWEIVGGALLLVPKLQGPVLAFSATMHASFALIGFVDFGSLALALLFAFIPPNYWQALQKKSSVRCLSLSIHRAYAYVLIILLGSVITGIYYHVIPIWGDVSFLHGVIFILGGLVLFWPLLATCLSARPLPWKGVNVFENRKPSIALLGFVLLFSLYGMTSYFGLRTAGNFSMFSNLRTEGEVSNHLLLSNNPLKFWSYQEDVVEVLEIDDQAVEIGHKYRPLKGNKLPVVEFKKLIHKWTQASYTVPISFVHNGVTYSSQDIVNEPIWQTPKRTWEMYLQDFRVIQPGGPNECRW